MQIKLRGFRIELGEIESAMADVPGVALAAALVLNSTAGSQQLVGYVTPETVDPAAVLESLRARLPAHFVPLLVIPLRQMPLLPNEKVDRKALASSLEYQPDWSAVADADGYVEPRSELERAVQAVWQEVLGLEQVSVESDFFRIGGNSIMANKVTTRLRAAMDAPLSGGAIFQHPTVAGLAKELSELGVNEPGSGGLVVPRAGFDEAALLAGVPASSMQEQLLRSEFDSLVYMEELMNERLVGPLDVDAVVGAWEALLMHQPVLRTRFKDEGDRMLQVRNTLPPDMHVHAGTPSSWAYFHTLLGASHESLAWCSSGMPERSACHCAASQLAQWGCLSHCTLGWRAPHQAVKQAAHWAQIVEPGVVDYCRMKVLDLRAAVSANGVQPVVNTLSTREAGTPFEPYRSPPVRATVARLGEDDHALILLAHHVRAPHGQPHQSWHGACMPPDLHINMFGAAAVEPAAYKVSDA